MGCWCSYLMWILRIDIMLVSRIQLHCLEIKIELIEKILQMEQENFQKSNEGNINLARRYSIGNVSRYYVDLINKN